MEITKVTRRRIVFLPVSPTTNCLMLALHHLAWAIGLALPVLLALNRTKNSLDILSIFLQASAHPWPKLGQPDWARKGKRKLVKDQVKLKLKQAPILILLVTLASNPAESLFPKGQRNRFDHWRWRHPWIVYIKHDKLKAGGAYASFIYLNEACGPPAWSLTYLVYMKLLPYDKEHSL